MLAVIAGGLDDEPPQLDERPPAGRRAGDAPLVALAEALVRSRTIEAQLAYELVATKADLGRIVVAARRGDDEPDVRTLRGWRREMVGAELVELLAGRRRLSVGGGGRIQVED